MNQSIVISKSGVKTEFEVLVFKYANAIEGADNAKAVRNVKSDRIDDTADALLVDNNFDKRLKEVVGLMHDFGATISTSGDNVTVAFVVTSRWAGNTDTLLSTAKAYILDGMLADWYNASAPTEAAIYITRIQTDVTNLMNELYKKGTPQ